MVLSPRFGRFVLAGIAGFSVDTGILTALHHGAGMDPFSARILSMSAAALVTWRINRAMTFGSSGSSQAAEGLRYAGVTAATAVINYLIYAAVLLLVPRIIPAFAVTIAAAGAMGFTYVGYSRFVFSGPRATLPGDPRLHRR